MSKTKTVEARSFSDKAKEWVSENIKKYVIPAVDRLLQFVATVFMLGTSFLYVRNWLANNQVNHDFSLAGAILVMSVALYLIVRKR